MEMWERELLVARISSGLLRMKIQLRGGPKVLVVHPASPAQLYEAQEIYAEQLHHGSLNGLMMDNELEAFLLSEGIWDDEKQKLYDSLPKEIEQFKVDLYKNVFKSQRRKVVREALRIAREKLGELEGVKSHYEYLSCRGQAAMARMRYLLACRLRDAHGKPVFNIETFWDENDSFFDVVAQTYASMRPSEETIRELARTDPWKGVYAVRKSEAGVFGIPVAEYTDEQRALVGYSSLYEHIYQHPDAPADAVLEDDDMTDGWLIIQRRKQDADKKQKVSEAVTENERIKNAQEVFKPVDTLEDARALEELNDPIAQARKRGRFKYLEKHGTVREGDMPDTKRELKMQANNMFNERARGG